MKIVLLINKFDDINAFYNCQFPQQRVHVTITKAIYFASLRSDSTMKKCYCLTLVILSALGELIVGHAYINTTDHISGIRMFLSCPDPDPHKFADPDPGKKARK